MGLFQKLFGGTKQQRLEDFTARGAVVLDVRSRGEYDSGAIPGAKNIPLQQVSSKIETIKKWNKPVITCCASGMRSGKAAKLLRQVGLEAHNGGAWQSVERARQEK